MRLACRNSRRTGRFPVDNPTPTAYDKKEFKGRTRRGLPAIVTKEGIMKQHKFWAFAMLFCMAMLFYTGYQHK